MMTSNFRDLLRKLNAHAVKYLVVSGHAFGVHAEPRTTKDLDVFVRWDPENANTVFKALAEFGAPIQGMTPADFTDGTKFRMGVPPERIDILQKIDGVTFDQPWSNRIEGTIDGDIRAGVISRDDLIRNKLPAGREQDLLDVKTLRKAAEAARTQK